MFPLVLSLDWRPSWSTTGVSRREEDSPLHGSKDVSSSRGPEGPAEGRRTLRRGSGSSAPRSLRALGAWSDRRPPPGADLLASTSHGPCRVLPPTACLLPPSIGSSSSFLLLESSNFEKMSFCQIRRDSLWSFWRSTRTQSQPLEPGSSQQQALRPPLSLVWARPSHSFESTPVQRPDSSHA